MMHLLAIRRNLLACLRKRNRRRRAASVRSGTRPTRSVASRLSGWLLYGFYLLVAAAAILAAGEALLLAIHAATQSETLATLENDELASLRFSPEYPQHPGEWLKIAVFGGSTAAGDHSTRAFSSVIEHDLKRQYPDRKIFVKNYARPGYPFHRHQAEYVKLLIDEYDLFIIYCGNNEAENYFDDIGYWRSDEYKYSKDLQFRPPVEARAASFDLLERHSRIFALICRAKRVLGRIETPVNKPLHHAEIEPRDALPADQREKLVMNFERDIEDICRLAAMRNKRVLLAVTATNETWPPFCSCFPPDTTSQQQQEWRQVYQTALREIEAGDFRAAIPLLERANEAAPGVAIASYRLGLCYLQFGQSNIGRNHLRRAIDQDAFYSRSITALHQKAKELSQKHDCLRYVDVVARMHKVFGRGISDGEVFSDHCHMRLLGHVIVGRAFLDELRQIEPFRSWPATARDDPGESDWRLLGSYYQRELGVSGAEEASITLSRINFFFKLAYLTAYPEHCYAQIDEQLGRLEAFDDGSPAGGAQIKLSQARLAVRREDYQEATKLLNEARMLSAVTLEEELNGNAYHRFVRDEFTEAGIRYVAESDRYELKSTS